MLKMDIHPPLPLLHHYCGVLSQSYHQLGCIWVLLLLWSYLVHDGLEIPPLMGWCNLFPLALDAQGFFSVPVTSSTFSNFYAPQFRKTIIGIRLRVRLGCDPQLSQLSLSLRQDMYMCTLKGVPQCVCLSSPGSQILLCIS